MQATTLKAKTEFTYDSGSTYFTNVTGKDNHDDTNYGSGFVTGRGNLCVVTRYEIGASGTIQTDTGWNSLGQVTFTRDGEDHQTNISYADSFSDGVDTRNTNAYPTSIEDADENVYLTKYNYDFGAVTRTEDPLGAVVTQTFDSIGRQDATTNLASHATSSLQARTRYEYGPDYVLTYVRGFDGTNEAYTNTQFDGAGRLRRVASDLPGSTGGYRATYTRYDTMGRVSEQSNPTEVDDDWVPAGEDVGGFAYTTQTYDWKGRPLETSNQDETTKTVSYSVCGCAGTESVTILDELSRKQKITSDVFGRTVKQEIYSNSTTVDQTIVTTYNLLDQPTQIRQYAGTDSSSTYQDTTVQYDGYGRSWKTHKPEFTSSTYQTTTYNDDNTRETVTDPRGSVATFSYNDRHLVTGISYSAPSNIVASPSTTFTYDDAGNRLTMTSSVSEVEYHYNTASRMTSEIQTITGVSGDYTLTYQYKPAGALESIEDPFGRTVTYSYHKTGELLSVSGTDFPDVTSFVSSTKYRAWGGAENISYGNGVDENIEYNERMLPTEYELENLRIWDNSTYSDQTSFDYYNDGRLFHSFYDAWSTKFDRKFQYDFAGRVLEAYSGREAHDQSPTTPRDNPFRQSFQYDAFGNLKERNGMLWSQTVPTDSDTFTNNRRSEWDYDDAGNVTLTEVTGTSYDASGIKVIGMTGQTDDLGNGDYRSYSAAIYHSLDGDGLIRKRSEYRYEEESIGSNWNYDETTTDRYNLWSTVLGAMVAEMDVNGNQKSSFVYAGKKIASLEIGASSSEVAFEFSSPQTGTKYTTDDAGIGGRDSEFDPLGALVPNHDPSISSHRLYADQKRAGQLFIGGGDPFRFDGNCQLDGMPTSCDLVQRLMSVGGLAVQVGTGAARQIIPIDSYGLGTYSVRFWESKSGRNRPKDESLHDWADGKEAEIDGDVLTTNGYGDAGAWRNVVVFTVGGMQQQNNWTRPPGVVAAKDVDYARSVYQGELGETLTKCINKVFSKFVDAKHAQPGANGPKVGTGANLLEYQQLRNAPNIKFEDLGPTASGSTGPYDYKQGIIRISTTNISSFEDGQRTYVHELGNHLATLVVAWDWEHDPQGNLDYFGDPNGIVLAPGAKPDPDSGAALENCVFGPTK